jgi:DNA-binding winged helix-turn-helix (wHTH) protein
MARSGRPTASCYRFDDVVVDRATFRVHKGAETPSLAPRAFDLLIYLIEHADRVVDKHELLEHVWGEAFVSDNALTRAVKEIRQAIGDDADSPRYVQTVPKRGYRFIGRIEPTEAACREEPAGVRATDERLNRQEPEQADFEGSRKTSEQLKPELRVVEDIAQRKAEVSFYRSRSFVLTVALPLH